FTHLLSGTYQLTETPPAGFLPGMNMAGTAGGTVVGYVISGIVLPVGFNAVNYTFADIPLTPGQVCDLGIADNFNEFIFHNATQSATDVEGRAAIGGNASLTNFGVGDGLTNSHGTRDDLIVGGNLTYNTGQ